MYLYMKCVFVCDIYKMLKIDSNRTLIMLYLESLRGPGGTLLSVSLATAPHPIQLRPFSAQLEADSQVHWIIDEIQDGGVQKMLWE